MQECDSLSQIDRGGDRSLKPNRSIERYGCLSMAAISIPRSPVEAAWESIPIEHFSPYILAEGINITVGNGACRGRNTAETETQKSCHLIKVSGGQSVYA